MILFWWSHEVFKFIMHEIIWSKRWRIGENPANKLLVRFPSNSKPIINHRWNEIQNTDWLYVCTFHIRDRQEQKAISHVSRLLRWQNITRSHLGKLQFFSQKTFSVSVPAPPVIPHVEHGRFTECLRSQRVHTARNIRNIQHTYAFLPLSSVFESWTGINTGFMENWGNFLNK